MQTNKKMLMMGGLVIAACAQAMADDGAPRATGDTLGWGKPSIQSPTFDPGFKVGFKGKVVGVQIYPTANGGPEKVDALVKLKNGGTALVELGPKSFLDQHGIKIHVKDTIYVSGSKVFVNGLSVILPTNINHAGSKVAFRNAEGQPFWDPSAFKSN